MKVQVEIDVQPVLVKNSSRENAARIGALIADMDRLAVFNHYVCDDGLLILIDGIIGNMADNLIITLAGVEQRAGELYCRLHQRAMGFAKFISDEEAAAMISSSSGGYGDLLDDMSELYS